MSKGCLSCRFKWFGSADKNVNFAQFYCAKSAAVRRRDFPVIGDDAALRAAPRCKDFKRAKDD